MDGLCGFRGELTPDRRRACVRMARVTDRRHPSNLSISPLDRGNGIEIRDFMPRGPLDGETRLTFFRLINPCYARLVPFAYIGFALIFISASSLANTRQPGRLIGVEARSRFTNSPMGVLVSPKHR